MCGTPYRVKLQQDTVGPFEQSSKDAPQIDFSKAVITRQHHHSRHEYTCFNPATCMLTHPRPGMCCRKTPPTGLSNQRSVQPQFVDTVEERVRLIEILHEPGISLTQRLPAHLQWQHIGAVLWLI